MRTFFREHLIETIHKYMNIFTCMEKSVVIQATGRFASIASLLSVAPLSRARDFTVLTFDGVIQPFNNTFKR